MNCSKSLFIPKSGSSFRISVVFRLSFKLLRCLVELLEPSSVESCRRSSLWREGEREEEGEKERERKKK